MIELGELPFGWDAIGTEEVGREAKTRELPVALRVDSVRQEAKIGTTAAYLRVDDDGVRRKVSVNELCRLVEKL